jgi:signal peptidase II
MKIDTKKRVSFSLLLPLALTLFVVIADQAVKSWIVFRWPQGPILDVFNNDFLWMYHVRNTAIAFSLGDGLPDPAKKALFIALPIAALFFILRYYFKTDEFTRLQRWAVAGVIGGGVGNLLDRILRPDGVVDFVSVKLYGFLGFERWPTFNIADAAVVVSVFLFILGMVLVPKGEAKTRAGKRGSGKT